MNLPSRSSQPATGSDTSGLGEYFTIGELLGFVARRKLLMIASIIGGAILGLLVAWIQPTAWTATALVQVGQVGLAAPATGNPEAFGIAIEPATRAAERIRNRAFVRRLLQRLNLLDVEGERDPEARLVRDSLGVIIPKNTDLLEIRVSGSTPDAARKHASAVLSMLATAHAQLAEPTLARLRGQLKHTSAQLERALNQRQALARSTASESRGIRPSDRFAASVLLSQLAVTNDEEIRKLRGEQLALEEQLSPNRTFPTALLTDIDVSDHPTQPKRLLYLLGGAGLGLLAALCWVLARSPKRD